MNHTVHKTAVWFLMKILGHKEQLAPRSHALGTMIKKNYHRVHKAVNLFRFKNFEHLLGSGGNHNLRPGCRRHQARTFHTPARCPQAWRTCTFPSPQSQ